MASFCGSSNENVSREKLNTNCRDLSVWGGRSVRGGGIFGMDCVPAVSCMYSLMVSCLDSLQQFNNGEQSGCTNIVALSVYVEVRY